MTVQLPAATVSFGLGEAADENGMIRKVPAYVVQTGIATITVLVAEQDIDKVIEAFAVGLSQVKEAARIQNGGLIIPSPGVDLNSLQGPNGHQVGQ